MSPKKKSKSARTRYMITDFTPAQRAQVVNYCRKHNISVARFLAELALEDARRASEHDLPEQDLTITIKIPAAKLAKLQIFAQRQKKTTANFLRDLVLPALDKQKTSFVTETTSLRYYLSPDEHRLVTKNLKARRLSARNYISFLALKEIRDKNN
jgi:hypothetical protein